MTQASWVVLVWDGFKDAFAPAGAAARTVLHIHIGLALYLGTAAVRRKGLRSWLGLAIVLVPTLANEWMDLTVHASPVPSWLWSDSIGDVLSTLAWPFVLFVGAGLFSPRDAGRAGKGAEEGADEVAAPSPDAP